MAPEHPTTTLSYRSQEQLQSWKCHPNPHQLQYSNNRTQAAGYDQGIGFTLSCLGCKPARDSSSQNRSTWTASSMSHKASLTSKTESGPTWSNQPLTNWHKRGTTALEELAMQNKKSLQIKQIYYAYFYPLPTSHFMHDGCDMSTIFLTLTLTTHPIYEDRYLLRAKTPEACRCRVSIHTYYITRHPPNVGQAATYRQYGTGATHALSQDEITTSLTPSALLSA